MSKPIAEGPDSTAVRVALWRALHIEQDAAPHVLNDVIGLELAAPDADWRQRPDMNPDAMRMFRASIIARARFIEDMVTEQVDQGLGQYVLLGAGLDTFVQRCPEIASRLTVYEVDQPGHQAWKQRRLVEAGYGIPDWQRFIPVDFEAGDSWLEKLKAAGFDTGQPALITSTGVSMYLTRAAIMSMLREIASLAPGSRLVMSFLLPIEMADPEDQPGLRMAENGAKRSGTPFISLFKPEEMLAMATEAGFAQVQHVSAASLAQRYFAGRPDGLRPPNNSEEILVAIAG